MYSPALVSLCLPSPFTPRTNDMELTATEVSGGAHSADTWWNRRIILVMKPSHQHQKSSPTRPSCISLHSDGDACCFYCGTHAWLLDPTSIPFYLLRLSLSCHVLLLLFHLYIFLSSLFINNQFKYIWTSFCRTGVTLKASLYFCFCLSRNAMLND